MAVEILVEKQLGVNVNMKIGDRVRVKESVIIYHHPEHRSQPFDIKGLEGEVVQIATVWKGKPISANLPFVVQFSKKFKAHLRDNELEII
ncbi:ferredoxin thioredoxin reductase, alpha chain [Tolypothrix sp. NIES-4075]|uniref:ferredoxin-thioredoxin reductase variable chain n=1 Tax=Tolypothrix sp. NIES-4075 TaxID=2005459 RepID=UPI000B5C48C2|nr:ferredoxin-thioredoxin reductase variable chain [Tolypothrix sp. NIES-4075]GAX42026.1 ferredoxin thioredoxin reductase, alpha chain [Tolypothrix sp. NIES-4075]